MCCDFHEHQPTRVNTSFCYPLTNIFTRIRPHAPPPAINLATMSRCQAFWPPLDHILQPSWETVTLKWLLPATIPRQSPPDHFLSTRRGAQWHTFLVSHSPVSRELGLAVLIPRFTIEPRMATYFTTSRAHTCLPRTIFLQATLQPLQQMIRVPQLGACTTSQAWWITTSLAAHTSKSSCQSFSLHSPLISDNQRSHLWFHLLLLFIWFFQLSHNAFNHSAPTF